MCRTNPKLSFNCKIKGLKFAILCCSFGSTTWETHVPQKKFLLYISYYNKEYKESLNKSMGLPLFSQFRYINYDIVFENTLME